ncbi:peptidase S8/S53 domain-containing protein [Chaetomium fimeti]|uniref:Peptidase S8/S53 domain-containing protein n=1 Tax=Chaetomium fimeti TaxID=1854472 RepID=A0AAE0LMU8_9PEZI|nr:peptidase S8/S53 domain-containing protein [Chaetomium fimeti]
MRFMVIQVVVYRALGALLLWPSVVASQQHQQPRIALKLTEEAQAKQQDDPGFIASLIQQASPASFRLSATEEISVDQILKSHLLDDLKARVVAMRKLDTTFKVPNFEAWYNIQVGSGGTGGQARRADENAAQDTTGTGEPRLALPKYTVELIHQLYQLPEVESAHALHPGPPPGVNAGDDPRSRYQGYLNAAPQGINARYAWGFPGGNGEGDLATSGITLISGRNQAWFGHGTSVLGEMFMVDNQIGGVGIVPAAKGRVVSQHREDWTYNTADAILDAAAHLSFGDIILVEAQEYDPVSGVYDWPVEVVDVNFDAIQLATAMGITVVQAGCNGRNDLDQYTSLSGKRIFDRSSPDFRDSGAIMVGGANPLVPHTPWFSSNYGSRIDVYAWAEGVETADTDDTGTANSYTSSFRGTSSASPIIVGTAAIIQAISQKRHNTKMHPIELRRILTTTGGTPSADPATDRIGIMPDLKTIIDTIFAGANHTSDPHTRDHTPLAKPAGTLGTAIVTTTNPSLPHPAIPGTRPLHVPLPPQPRQQPADPATAIVYWLPRSRRGVGKPVMPRLGWTAPVGGYGCGGGYWFVAVVWAGPHPVPVMPAGVGEFVAVVVRGSNIVGRNGTGIHRFPVRIRRAFDESREFIVRCVRRLPEGSRVRLQVPQVLAGAINVKACGRRGADGQGVVVVKLEPGEMAKVPDEAYEYALVQQWQGVAVGR